MQLFFRRGFTMIELLVTIVIIAIIATVATVFVGDYISRARLTAAQHTVAVLNESLNEYRTLGGLANGYSLKGSHASTVNAATLTTAALEAMQVGFTNFGSKRTFVKSTETLNTAYIGSTGSGKSFRFVVDATKASAGTVITKITPTLTMSDTAITLGTAQATITVTTSTDALFGQAVRLKLTNTSNNTTVTSAAIMGSSRSLTFVMDTDGLPVGKHSLLASAGAFSVGNTQYAAASVSRTLTVSSVTGVGYMAKASAGTYAIYATTTTGYMAFKDASGTVSIKGVSLSTPASLASSLSYTFWSCAGAGDSTAAGNLTYFTCPSNQLTSLDVSGCTALTGLGCYSNQLTSLDVSNNTALTSLGCNSNSLTSLDVSNNTALTSLSCYSNSLTSLDVSGCTALTYLGCYSNALTSLNASGCTALTSLNCYSNQLTSLDVSSNTALTSLRCYGNTALVGTASALQLLYNSLPTVSAGTLTIGTAASTDTTYDSIATAKKWTIRRTGS